MLLNYMFYSLHNNMSRKLVFKNKFKNKISYLEPYLGRGVVQLHDGRLLDDFHIEKQKQEASSKLKEKIRSILFPLIV